MKRYLAPVILLLITLNAYGAGQPKWNQKFQNYINRYKDLAIEEMLKYHIPASITLAQGLFESGAGQSDLALKGNNHFGIKCHEWSGATIYHDDDAIGECFRAYNNVYESYEDHSKFLKNNVRYSRLFRIPVTDYKGWARGLKECGYATNPNYAQRLIEIIELYRLYEYDTARSYDRFIAKHSSTGGSSGTTGRLHTIYMYNDNYYMKAREGDTFRSIGKEVELPYRALARYNERDHDAVLHEGDIVYLKKKRKKADKAYKNRPHIVRNGESMYSIAQLYGIRTRSLYKKNNLSSEYRIKVGDVLKVY